MFTEQDLILLNKKGILPEDIENQIAYFKQGFPYLKLHGAASIEKGIKLMTEKEQDIYMQTWDYYRSKGKKIIKFVPASGAASRMFKNLFEFLDASYNVPTTDFEKRFFDNILKFAFYDDLDEMCKKNEEKNITQLIEDGNYKAVVNNLLFIRGLNYGNLPKGLLKFHSYPDGSRTPVEEHLTEGAIYAKDNDDEVNIHFTVSPDHHQLFIDLVFSKKASYEAKLHTKFNVSFSEQKSKTDTIAVDMNNELFRDNGSLLFRPGGHGALIENLNDLDGDVIFIKNIDNVVPDRLKDYEAKYKKLLAGVLVESQSKAFQYLELLDSGRYTHDELMEILYFLQNDLNIKNPDTKLLEDAELVLYLKRKLDRPFRVCGMVRNVGEPGGGPFLAENSDGTISLQILESSQIDMNNNDSKLMFEQGTHFNPVDLVCGVKDYRGNKFNLLDYVDKNTGFISLKSKSGKELKALELPGLWNGAMSDWNTIFVEVPIETFNPVKTVNDLLRKEHQA
ncbi:DUF4301 family protein [Dysgonomonas sp. 520]|uniref:DUF4301 family protein n=1 Tax=Dysgonomonas sp. 520 TaxID=2302931 RepID=UPI0013D3C0EE|nr:DUF4301 family protein [Dysgonomonas sp. 520]NDW09129.1 DUF4301 family protein [Dysgonomonas sp. 520]